jgi:hypothetical protein
MNTQPSPNLGHIKAAGDQNTAEWLLKTVIPSLRRYAREHGRVEQGGGYAHVEGTLRSILNEGLGLGGSHVRVAQIFQRDEIKLLTRVRRRLTGTAASRVRSSDNKNIYAVNMTRQYRRNELEEAVLTVAIAAEERRRAHYAGPQKPEQPEEVEVGRVTEHHEHRDVLDHPHGDRAGKHYHEQRNGPPLWFEALPKHSKPEEPPLDNGVVRQQEVTRSLMSGNRSASKAAVITRDVRDGRYRALLDIISDQQATIGRRDKSVEKLMGEKDALVAENRELHEENRRLEARVRELEATTDPTTVEADEVIAAYQARKEAPVD